MRTSLFAACVATCASVEAASLVTIPTYDLQEIEEIELAEIVDYDAFATKLSQVAHSEDITPAQENIFMQSLSEADSQTMSELYAAIQSIAHMQNQDWFDDVADWTEQAVKDVGDFAEGVGNDISEIADDIADTVGAVFDIGITEPFTASLLVIGKAIEMGPEAF